MVDDDGGSGLRGGGAVRDERAGKTPLEHAEATGYRNQIREVADQITKHERRDGERVPGGRKDGAECGDVEAEIAGGAEQPPARCLERATRPVDAGGDVDQPFRPVAVRQAADDDRDREDGGRRREATEYGDPGAHQAERPCAGCHGEQRAGADERGHIDGARQEEQRARAVDDALGRHPGAAKQPAADRERADSAAGQQRAGPLLGPRKLARGPGSHPIEVQPEDHYEPGARAELEPDRDEHPRRVKAVNLRGHTPQRRHRQ